MESSPLRSDDQTLYELDPDFMDVCPTPPPRPPSSHSCLSDATSPWPPPAKPPMAPAGSSRTPSAASSSLSGQSPAPGPMTPPQEDSCESKDAKKRRLPEPLRVTSRLASSVLGQVKHMSKDVGHAVQSTTASGLSFIKPKKVPEPPPPPSPERPSLASSVESSAPPAPPPAPAPRWTLALHLLVQICAGAWLLWLGLGSHLFIARRDAWLSSLAPALLGAGASFGLCAAYAHNLRLKVERAARYRLTPGAKGTQELLHSLPSWLSFRKTEQVEWVNRAMRTLWPYVDVAVCAAVRTQVEPILQAYKPSFVKKASFVKLTFGSNPLRVEGVRVSHSSADKVVLEVDFRWAGDANIVLGIEVPVGGKHTRLAPKVSDLAVSGRLMLVLTPLRDGIPPFGAALVAFTAPPIVRFHLSFGRAFGGSVSASAVRLWLDDFLRNQVSAMALWPARVVVPLVGDDLAGPALDDLYLRHRGVLCVDVLGARELPAAELTAVGGSEVQVSIFSTARLKRCTQGHKHRAEVTWNERLWLMVQEPDSQHVYIVVHSVDAAHLKGVLQLGVFKTIGDVLRSEHLLGRAMLPLQHLVGSPGRAQESWLPLGLGEFNDARMSESHVGGGCGDGRGELRVSATYWPFELMKGHEAAHEGAVIVTLLHCDDLAPMDKPMGTSDPYVAMRIGKERRTSSIQYRTLAPRWVGEHFDWFSVAADSRLHVKVLDHDQWTADDVCGYLEIDIAEQIAKAPMGDITDVWELEDVPVDSKTGRSYKSTISMRIQWIPYRRLEMARKPGKSA